MGLTEYEIKYPIRWRDIHFLGMDMEVKARFVTGRPAPAVQDHDAPGFANDGEPDRVEDIVTIRICEGNIAVPVSAEMREIIENTDGFIEACFEGE